MPKKRVWLDYLYRSKKGLKPFAVVSLSQDDARPVMRDQPEWNGCFVVPVALICGDKTNFLFVNF